MAKVYLLFLGITRKVHPDQPTEPEQLRLHQVTDQKDPGRQEMPEGLRTGAERPLVSNFIMTHA